MLEKPDLPDNKIITCLQHHYGLTVAGITFLPLGADTNTAVYRAVTGDGTAYFVKLRRGRFDPLSVTLPKWLNEQGIQPIIAPLATNTGQLWANLDNFTLILYPFVAGQDGYERPITEQHWQVFGRALRGIHAAALPSTLLTQLRHETYPSHWSRVLQEFLEHLGREVYTDAIAADLAAFLPTKRAELEALITRTTWLAQTLQSQNSELVVCHSDLHAGNFLITDDKTLYIVDWDAPILAPKERDLMYVGGGQMKNWYTPQQEEALFYPAYGPTQVNHKALAYYRYARIIEDIALFCQEIRHPETGDADRAQSLAYLKANFRPNGVLDIAYRMDQVDYSPH